MDDNLFKVAKDKSGLSYKDIATTLKKQTDKDVDRRYIHSLISEPGLCKNRVLMLRIGLIVGLSEEEAEKEWSELRVIHKQQLFIQSMKRSTR